MNTRISKKMRKWALYGTFLTGMWLIAFTGYGQQRTPCDHGIELLGGPTQFGYMAQIGFTKYFPRCIYGKVSTFYAKELDRDLWHYVYGGEASIGYMFLRPVKNIYLAALGGIGYSHERGRWKEADFDSYIQNKFSFLAGIEGEYYFHKKWSVIVNYNQHLVTDQKKSWGFHRWYVLAGVRFHFYRLHHCTPTSTHSRQR